MRKPIARRVLPVYSVFLVATALSTGTVLASDTCGVSIVKTLTEAARHAEEHTEPAHKHTKATLARWQEWGNLYLAKHGHPYVPPKRSVALHPMTPEEQEARFKLECEMPPVPTVDLAAFDVLPPEELLPVADEFPVDLPTYDAPAAPVNTATVVPPAYAGVPIFFFPGGGSVPAAPTPPIGPTPEPGSVVLLGTGLLAMFGLFKMAKRSAIS